MIDVNLIVEILAKVFEFLGLNYDAAAIVDAIVAWFESIIAMLG